MTRLADRMYLISESQTIQMSKKSRELRVAGHDIINLSLGEPDFITPDYIRNGAKKAIDNGYTHYTPIAGYQVLREAISQKFKRDNNLDFNADQIVVSTGAKQSIANVILSLINPGDEVIIPAPYWVSYVEIVKLAGGIPVFIHSQVESDFKITGEQLSDAITPRSKMFIYSSPCNPTGTVYNHEELFELKNVFIQNPGLFILSDEIYEYINFTSRHVSIADFQELREQTIVVNGFSKGFAMTGWRVGYIGAPLWIANACDKIQGQFTSGTCSISQWAAVSALAPAGDELELMRQSFKHRRDIMLEQLCRIPGIKLNNPLGAFYIFPDISSYFGKSSGNYVIRNSTDLCMYLLDVAQVSVVMGEAFGAPSCIRISYAASETELRKACERIGSALSELK